MTVEPPDGFMRICYVAPFGLGQKTTVWARVLPLAHYLAGQGHEVSIFIPPWDTPGDAGKAWLDGDVHVVNVALAGGLPLVLGRLLRRIGDARPHIVHIVKPRAHAGMVQWVLWHARRWWPGPEPCLLLDVDDWEQAWASVAGYAWPVARFLAWQEEWGIRHADGITAASRWLVERVQGYTPGIPVLYLPNGVIAPETPSQDNARPTRQHRPRPTVLWFSRFVEVEPAWLAAFWQALRSAVPDVHLTVAGQPLQPQRGARFRAALGSSAGAHGSSVTWLGYVQPSALPALYAQADCAIFPAANMPLNQAKCSVRLATTLLHGVPVVASAVGEQVGYGTDGAARLVPAEATPAQFAQAVADVLSAPAEQRRLAQQARRHLLQRYNWAYLGRRLDTFYRAVVRSP